MVRRPVSDAPRESSLRPYTLSSYKTCGIIMSGESIFPELTNLDTSYAFIYSAGYGVNRFLSALVMRGALGSNHRPSCFSGIMTGILLCMGLTTLLGVVVIILQDVTTSPLGDFQESHIPAKPKGLSDFSVILIGIFVFPMFIHS